MRGRWPLSDPEGPINTIVNVIERQFTVTELKKLLKENRVLEIFGTGTAVGCVPVGKLKIDDTEYLIPSGNNVGPICEHVYKELNSILYGQISDHPLSYIIE